MGDEIIVQVPEEIINELPENKVINPLYVTPEHVFEWKKQFLKEGHSIPSTDTYFSFIKRYVNYGAEINQKTVNTFRNKHMSSPCSAGLKSFFSFLVNKMAFPDSILNIRFDKNKNVRKFPKSLPTIEVETLINSMPNLKDKIFTKTLYELGLRISEGLKLKWEDFSWSEWLQDRTKQGTVNLKNTKGGKFRSIPVNPQLMEMLYTNHQNKSSTGIPLGTLVFDYGIMEYLVVKENSLLQNQANYLTYAKNRYRDLIYRVSKDTLNRRINPHQLRHAKAQDMTNKGVDILTIKAYLGHARISSTEIYAQASAEKLKKDMEAYNNLNNGQP